MVGLGKKELETSNVAGHISITEDTRVSKSTSVTENTNVIENTNITEINARHIKIFTFTEIIYSAGVNYQTCRRTVTKNSWIFTQSLVRFTIDCIG